MNGVVSQKNESFFVQKKHVFFFSIKTCFLYSLTFCYTPMLNRYILIKCYVILLRIAIANIWGLVKC